MVLVRLEDVRKAVWLALNSYIWGVSHTYFPVTLETVQISRFAPGFWGWGGISVKHSRWILCGALQEVFVGDQVLNIPQGLSCSNTGEKNFSRRSGLSPLPDAAKLFFYDSISLFQILVFAHFTKPYLISFLKYFGCYLCPFETLSFKSWTCAPFSSPLSCKMNLH